MRRSARENRCRITSSKSAFPTGRHRNRDRDESVSLAGMLVAAMDKQGKGARRLEASFFRTDGAVRTIMVDTGRR